MSMEGWVRRGFDGAKRVGGEFLADESSGGKGSASEDAAKVLRLTLTGFLLYQGVPASALAKERHQAVHATHEKHEAHEKHEKGFTAKDFELVAKNIFYESSLEGPEGQLAVAQVTFARLVDGRWGRSIHDVVYAKHQFSWTDEQKTLSPIARDGIRNLTKVFVTHFKGKSAQEIVRELSGHTGLPAATLYYKRADWREDDPNDPHMSERTKQVFQSLVWIKNIADHAFYMEAPKKERIAQSR